MKKHTSKHLYLAALLVLLCSSFTEKISAQTCSTPLTLTVNGCDNYSLTDSVVWLSFDSGNDAAWCNLTMSVPSGDPASITGAELYYGTCNSLTLVETGFADIGAHIVKGNVTPSTYYLLKVIRNSSSAGQLNVCTDVIASYPPGEPRLV